MTEDYAHALQLLEEAEAEFLGLIDGLSEAQWTYKPEPEGWSIAETAQHIVLAEDILFRSLQKALSSPGDPEWETKTAGKTEFVERVVPGRRRKARAPEAIRPRETWTREDTLARYREKRARTMQFVQAAERALDGHTFNHPFPVFNTLSAYQWLIYIPLHHKRHARQIAEIKASPGFPASDSLTAERDA